MDLDDLRAQIEIQNAILKALAQSGFFKGLSNADT